jgi:hypothetical protein
MFNLDSVSPTDYLEIDKEIEDANYSIRVGPLIGSRMTYRMVIQDSHGSSFFDATFVNSTNWLIEGATTIGTNHTLMLERTGSDVEVELSYSVTQTVIRPDVDPTPSVIQASVGGVVIILAILLGFIIEPEEKTQQA